MKYLLPVVLLVGLAHQAEARTAKYVLRQPVCTPFIATYQGGRIHHQYVPLLPPRTQTSLPATNRGPAPPRSNYAGGVAARDAMQPKAPVPQMIVNPFAKQK